MCACVKVCLTLQVTWGKKGVICIGFLGKVYCATLNRFCFILLNIRTSYYISEYFEVFIE